MLNQTLVDYIKSVKSQGYSDPAVIEALKKNGWQENDIKEAFSFINLSNQTPIAPNIIPPTTNASFPTNQIKTSDVLSENTEEYNSPFSMGLAVVLFVSLFVLANKIIHDVGVEFSKNINNKLIFDAVITIPFLFVSFLLYGIASQNRKRFIVVCQPYFVVSAFLFLRLLWSIGIYVLDKNATYGVYIVLVMAIVVLTGFVLFLQKFFKS